MSDREAGAEGFRTQARLDVRALVMVVGVVAAFYGWARFISPSHYLVSLAHPLMECSFALIGMLYLRANARRWVIQRSTPSRYVQQMAAPSNRGWLFGAPMILAAVILLLTWPTQRDYDSQCSSVATTGAVSLGLVLLFTRFNAQRLPTSHRSPGTASTAKVSAQTAVLIGCLVLTFGILIAGEAGLAQATGWTAYSVAEGVTPSAQSLGYADRVLAQTRSLLRTRYTRTRREIEFVQGTADFKSYDTDFNAAHWPTLIVRAGRAKILMAQSRWDPSAQSEFIIERAGGHVEVLARAGQRIAIGMSSQSQYGLFGDWFQTVRTLKPGELAIVDGDSLSVWPLSEAEQQAREAWTLNGDADRSPPVAQVSH